MRREKTLFQSFDIIKCKLEYPDRWSLLLDGRKKPSQTPGLSQAVGTQNKVQAGAAEKPAHHINCCSFSVFFSKVPHLVKKYFVS